MYDCKSVNDTNLLLTEREGRTGKYWREVDFNWLSNQFDDRCCRSAKTCVALE